MPVRMKRKLLSAIGVATILASLSVGMVAGGEVTGNGKKSDFSQGRSICKFSGLNDIPAGDPVEGPAGRVQSWGQDVRNGIFVPSQLKGGPPSPGFACNPNNDFGE